MGRKPILTAKVNCHCLECDLTQNRDLTEKAPVTSHTPSNNMAPKKAEKKEKAAKADKGTKVKRAPSPYINFCSEQRPKLKEANPDAGFGELGKLLGEQWKKLSESEKAVSAS